MDHAAARRPVDSHEAIAVERESSLSNMLSMRMIHLFLLLRRTTSIAEPSQLALSHLEWRVMTQLDGVSALSLSALAQRLILDRGQLSRTIKAMVERGLLTRKRKPGGPEIEIDLSEAGLAIRAAMIERAAARDRFLVEGLDPDDTAAAFRVINHMIARANLHLDRQNPQTAD